MEKEVFIIGIFIWKLKELMKPLYLFFFLFPLAGAMALGSLLDEKEKELAIPIAVVDEDGSDYSRAIIEGLMKQERLRVMELSLEEADRQLARNELDSVFVIKEQFQERLLAEERELLVELMTSSVSMASGIVKEVFASEVAKLTSAIHAANRVEGLYEGKGVEEPEIWEESYQYTMSQWNPEPLMTVSYETANLAVSEKIKAEEGQQPQRYLGLWTFFVLLLSFVTSEWIVRERGHLFSRMKTTAAGLGGYIRQTAAAHFLFYSAQALFVSAIMDSLGLIRLSVPLFMALIAYILFSLCISLAIGSISRNSGIYYAGGIYVSFIVVLAGEGLFPLAELSGDFASLSAWFPQKLIWTAAAGGPMTAEILPAAIGIAGSVFVSVWLVARRVKSS